MAAIQPSLRDFVNFGIGPGVETPGYYHDVPPGQRSSIGVYTILRRVATPNGKRSYCRRVEVLCLDGLFAWVQGCWHSSPWFLDTQ